MNRRRMKVLGLLFLGFFLLTACGSQGNAGKPPSKKGLKNCHEFLSIYALVKEISGDQNDIWMVQSGAGIHDYEPLPKKWPRSMMRMFLSIILRPGILGPVA